MEEIKIRKIITSAAAIAFMTTLCAHANAADWSKTTYADGNPDTCRLISTDENGATWTAAVDGDLAKIMITIGDIVENEDDIRRIHHGSWNITYNGLSAFSGTDVGWFGGGTYVCTGNSATYDLSPASWDEDGHAVWDDTVTVEDSFKWLLPSSVPPDGTAQLVFMDWSGQPLASEGVTLTVSDLKLYDKEGNEIAQKAYGAGGEDTPLSAASQAEEAPAIVAVAATASTPTASSGYAAVACVLTVSGAAMFLCRGKKK